MVWRPQTTKKEKIILKTPSKQSVAINHHEKSDNSVISSVLSGTPQPASTVLDLAPDEAPLRWELTTETMAYETNSLEVDSMQSTKQ